MRLEPPVAPVTPVLTVLDQRVTGLVTQISTLAASGEYKRHQVYALLIKEFPHVPHRDLGLAIEQAVQALP